MSQGNLIAGGAGVLLLICTFLPWIGGEGSDETANLWESTSSLDLYVLIVALVAIGAALTASGGGIALPGITLNGATVLLGAIAVVLIFFFLIGPIPGFGQEGAEPNEGVEKKIGLWLGLLAAIGVAVGGWMAAGDEAGPSTY